VERAWTKEITSGWWRSDERSCSSWERLVPACSYLDLEMTPWLLTGPLLFFQPTSFSFSSSFFLSCILYRAPTFSLFDIRESACKASMKIRLLFIPIRVVWSPLFLTWLDRLLFLNTVGQGFILFLPLHIQFNLQSAATRLPSTPHNNNTMPRLFGKSQQSEILQNDNFDPLNYLLQPPEKETREEFEARLREQEEAKKRSDAIDEEINRQRAELKKASNFVRVMLLGEYWY